MGGAASKSAPAHSTERRIEIVLAGGRGTIVDVRAEALRGIFEALDPR